MTNYYIHIVPLISVDGQASPRLFIAPEIRHEKTLLYKYSIYCTALSYKWLRGIASNLYARGPMFDPHARHFFIHYFLTYPRPKKLPVYPLTRGPDL